MSKTNTATEYSEVTEVTGVTFGTANDFRRSV